MLLECLFYVAGSAVDPYAKHVRDLTVGGNTFRFYDLKSFEDTRLGGWVCVCMCDFVCVYVTVHIQLKGVTHRGTYCR